MKKILVIGSSGMAGHVITKTLENKSDLEVWNISRSKIINDKTVLLNVTDTALLEDYLKNHEFDVIINCVGVLNQFAEERKDLAIFINSYIPHFLSYYYSKRNTKIIHLSTDCVFSGKTGNYTEISFKDGDTFYDRSKALGELNNNKDLTFRMSIIGPDMNPSGFGLFNWFMNSSGKINGYKNAIWTGVTTIELAKAIFTAISSDLTGLYHLVPSKSISKYELLELFKKEFKRNDIDIIPYDNEFIDKSLVNTRKDFNYQVPDYAEMVHDMRLWVEKNKNLYQHYFEKEV